MAKWIWAAVECVLEIAQCVLFLNDCEWLAVVVDLFLIWRMAR